MENDPIDGGVYLWGTLLDETHRPGRQPRYRSFADLHHPLTDPTEADLLAQLWEWLHTVLDATAADGRTARVYCWHQSAELTAMRRIATRSAGHPGVPTLGQIDHLARSGHWIDLEKEAIQRLWLPDGSSIKTIAPLAGHTWPMADAGGDQSIVWYRTATTAPAGPCSHPTGSPPGVTPTGPAASSSPTTRPTSKPPERSATGSKAISRRSQVAPAVNPRGAPRDRVHDRSWGSDIARGRLVGGDAGQRGRLRMG